MKKIKLIEDYLNELYSNPKCELNYNSDFELLICIMLSAQTTDKKVNIVSKELFNKYDTIEKLSKADIKDLKQILRPLGNHNKKSVYIKEISSIIYNDYNSKVPYKRNILESLPGVGRKTVNVFFSELDIEPNIAVDTHVSRVSKRLSLVSDNDDVLKIEKRLRRIFKKETYNKLHLQLVLFGRYNCKSINPNCKSCKLKDICKYYKERNNYEKNVNKKFNRK
jgi:endonuclease-3